MSSPCEDLQECRQNETGVKNPANKRADAHATPTLRNHWERGVAHFESICGFLCGFCVVLSFIFGVFQTPEVALLQAVMIVTVYASRLRLPGRLPGLVAMAVGAIAAVAPKAL